MNLLFKLSVLVLLFVPSLAFGELSQQLLNDFAPTSGYIIMPIGDEYLVDLDASTSLQTGDILTVVEAGEKVVHPITKEILGSLDLPKGFLQVTRIKSGYSYAKLLMADTPPQKGDQVRRYEQVPAQFISAGEDGAKIHQQLKTELPQLEWLDGNSTTEPLLTFELNADQLKVKGSNSQVIHSYKLADGRFVAPAPAAAATELPKEKVRPLQKAVNTVMDAILPGSDDRDPTQGIIRQDEQRRAGIWMSPSIQGEPVGIAAADFDQDGQTEIALAMNNRIQFGRNIRGQYQPTSELEIPTGISLLSLDSLDLDGNGQPELYLTAERQGELSSLAVEYIGNSYQITITDLPWYLRATNLPGQGEVLLGQRRGKGENHFTGKPFIIVRENRNLRIKEEVQLPEWVNIFSFTSFQADDGQQLYAYLSAGDYLKVTTAAGEVLWESGDYFGGTETRIQPERPSQNELVQPTYIPPRIYRTPSGEILVTQNDGLRTLQRFRRFKESRLIALTWNGHTLVESWRTSDQGGYLSDFTLADSDNDGSEEIVMAMQFKHKGLLQKARSAIVSYEMNNQ